MGCVHGGGCQIPNDRGSPGEARSATCHYPTPWQTLRSRGCHLSLPHAVAVLAKPGLPHVFFSTHYDMGLYTIPIITKIDTPTTHSWSVTQLHFLISHTTTRTSDWDHIVPLHKVHLASFNSTFISITTTDHHSNARTKYTARSQIPAHNSFTDADFEDCVRSGDHGGALDRRNANIDLIITRCTFLRCEVSGNLNYGGAIYAYPARLVELINTNFTSCRSNTSACGVMFIRDVSTCTRVSGCHFNQNRAATHISSFILWSCAVCASLLASSFSIEIMGGWPIMANNPEILSI